VSTESLSPFHTFAAANNLRVERVIGEVHDAFAAASIEAILLKGPAIAGWLYEEDEVRPYGDGDFLVARTQWEAAGSVLRGLGFQEDIARLEHPNLESFASYAWTRQREAGIQSIDLHATLSGIGADFPEVWAILSSDTSGIGVAGRQMRILGEPARAMHIALHAAHHHEGKQILDLERALERLDEAVWRAATEVARSLDATAAFATGLRLTPAGAALARRLGVHEARSVAATLKLDNVPLSEGLEYLAGKRGTGAKLAIVRDELVPTPDFLRWWAPELAGRGRLGLAGAYLWRVCWLLGHLPAGLLAWRRARRAAGD
jgi:Uncharacterised nucleotidyltransferase